MVVFVVRVISAVGGCTLQIPAPGRLQKQRITILMLVWSGMAWWSGWSIQSIPVLWPKVVIFGALRWPHQWFYQQRVVIWLWVDALGYNISKNQLPKSKTMASSHKKVHFWNPIWGTPSALWNGPSPISLSFLFWSRWDSVCQCTLGRPWFVPNLIKIHQDLAKI